MNLTMRLSSHYNHFPKPDGFYYLDLFFFFWGWGGGGGEGWGVCSRTCGRWILLHKVIIDKLQG